MRGEALSHARPRLCSEGPRSGRIGIVRAAPAALAARTFGAHASARRGAARRRSPTALPADRPHRGQGGEPTSLRNRRAADADPPQAPPRPIAGPTLDPLGECARPRATRRPPALSDEPSRSLVPRGRERKRTGCAQRARRWGLDTLPPHSRNQQRRLPTRAPSRTCSRTCYPAGGLPCRGAPYGAGAGAAPAVSAALQLERAALASKLAPFSSITPPALEHRLKEEAAGRSLWWSSHCGPR